MTTTQSNPDRQPTGAPVPDALFSHVIPTEPVQRPDVTRKVGEDHDLSAPFAAPPKSMEPLSDADSDDTQDRHPSRPPSRRTDNGARSRRSGTSRRRN